MLTIILENFVLTSCPLKINILTAQLIYNQLIV